MQNNEVEIAFHVLKRRKVETAKEHSVMFDLYHQLQLFCLNLKADGETQESQITGRCIYYLDSILDNTDNTSNNTNMKSHTTCQHHESTEQRVKQLGIVSTSIKDGKVIYLLDGHPIKFKKLRDTTVYHKRWEANYKELISFFQTHGHVKVTRSTEGFEELGNWVTEQRRKLKKGKVSQRQFELLNQLGFEWDRSHYFYRTYHRKKPGEETQGNSSDETV